MTKKPDFDDYLAECAKLFAPDGDITKAEKNFEFNMRAAHQAAIRSEAISLILQRLKEARAQYVEGRPELLFYPQNATDEFTLLTKPFNSAILKAYRGNVIFNKKYPSRPDRGWINVEDIYQEIDDLLRTRLVCKYMDGPQFVCNYLQDFCENNNIDHKLRDLSTEAGYYAWHFYLKIPVEIMQDRTVSTRQMWVEFQISTQLAEVITSLTHALYEERRVTGSASSGTKWKWDAKSPMFRSAFLGHGLHLLEGLIQTLKDDFFSNSEGAVQTRIRETNSRVIAESATNED